MTMRLEQLGRLGWLGGPLAVCFSTVLLATHATHRPISLAGAGLFACGVSAAYALDYWLDQAEKQRSRAVLLLVSFSMAGAFFTALELPGWKIALAAGLGLIGLYYRSLKKWPMVKTILVTGAWTAAAMGLPVAGNWRDLLLQPFGLPLLALFAANSLLCDLKDAPADARAEIKTAVVLWGGRATALLAAVLAVVGVAAAVATQRYGLAGAGVALAALAAFPQMAARPVLGPALADGALILPAVFILTGWA
jgi:4-hydroxybenzoate polyprenyltransferase